jgi:predicted acyltransferase
MKPEPSGRLISLDVLCGVTIGAMIIVTNLRTWSDTPRFPHLMHAEWHGCTLADLVFPCFLFIVGVTTVSSLENAPAPGRVPSGYIVISLSALQFSSCWVGFGGRQNSRW